MSTFRIAKASNPDRKLRVVGHPFAPIGMGQHFRSVWRALTEVGFEADIVDIHGAPEPTDTDLLTELGSAVTKNLGAGVNIFCINGDEVPSSLSLLADRNPMAEGSRNIVFPAWELERYPLEWASQLMRFDEVWASSTYTRDAIAKVVSTPVVQMPLACEVRRRALRSRRHFRIRESAYVFLFAFDFLSYVERKNPFAVIAAFERLLALRPYDDVLLVIKTNNAGHRPEMKARFDAAILPLRERVQVIDATLNELDMKSLLWLCDCFVSLHRSEGFGFSLAEAMVLGKPVIATAYSGNMEYCTEKTAFLIPYKLVAVHENEYPHWQAQRWADPDIDAAIEVMLLLIDNQQLGRAKGLAARTHFMADFSYLAVGQTLVEQLSKYTS